MMPTTSAAVAADPELKLLVDLVRLSRLTLLYAPARSAKSAFLKSAVLPLLQRASGGNAREVAVLFDAWDSAPVESLIGSIEQALASALPRLMVASHRGMDLRSALKGWETALGVTFVVVLDRFERYLARDAAHPEVQAFENEFVAAANDRALNTHFLLSLDEEAAPLLSRLRERIPGFGDARLHLPRSALEFEPEDDINADHESVSGTFSGSQPPPREHVFVGSEPPPKSPVEAEQRAPAPEVERQPSTRIAPDHAAGSADGVPVFLESSQSREPENVRAESLAECVQRMRAERSRGESDVRSELVQGGALSLASAEADLRSDLVETRAFESPPAEPDVRSMPLENQVPKSLRAEPDVPPDPLENVRPTVPPEVSVRPHTIEALARVQPRESMQVRSVPHSAPREFPIPRLAWLAISAAILALSWWVIMRPQAPHQPGSIEQSAGGAAQTDGMTAGSASQLPAEAAQESTGNAQSGNASAQAAFAGPFLYIHVRNEEQRAQAERLIEPLAKRGVRVTGIKLVRFGPSVTDLRYFRADERDEAVRVGLVLREVGVWAQHLHQVGGFEDSATLRQYELWFPPPNGERPPKTTRRSR
jgi:hypothetical protein